MHESLGSPPRVGWALFEPRRCPGWGWGVALHVTYKGTFVLGRDEFFSQGVRELRWKRGGVAFCLPLEGPPLGPSYTATEGRWSWGPWSLFRENQGCEKFFMMLVVKVCDGNRQPLSQAPPPWPGSLSDGDARLKAFFTQPQKTILWMFAIGSQLNL